VFCRNCGENIPVDSVFCPHCGKNLMEIERVRETAGPTEELPIRPRTASRRSWPLWSHIGQKGPLWGDQLRAWIQHLSLFRVLWTMGLVFAGVGFIVGLTGHQAPALDWILFGFVLVFAAPYAPAPPDSTQQEMRD